MQGIEQATQAFPMEAQSQTWKTAEFYGKFGPFLQTTVSWNHVNILKRGCWLWKQTDIMQ